MTQRYESGAMGDSAGADDASKTRSQLAAERHMERMKKLREAKGWNSCGWINCSLFLD